MSYRLLSVDYSTKKTGFAVFDDESLIEYGLIDKSEQRPIEYRFHEMSMALWAIMDKYKPDLVGIEETVVSRNIQVQRYLTRMQGVMYAWCLIHDKSFKTIRPAQWRSLVGINPKGVKREELKQMAIDTVVNDYGISPETDDVAEGILIGQAFINMNANLKRG